MGTQSAPPTFSLHTCIKNLLKNLLLLSWCALSAETSSSWVGDDLGTVQYPFGGNLFMYVFNSPKSTLSRWTVFSTYKFFLINYIPRPDMLVRAATSFPEIPLQEFYFFRKE